MPAARPAPRRAARDKADILARAGEVMAERGVERTRFSDVAEHAGTSVSTLQYLFGSREDLVVQALRGRSAHFLREAARGSAAIGDPLERLRWLAGHLTSYHAPDDEAARADWALWVEYWRTALRDPELGPESREAYEGWVELVRNAIRSAVAAGVVAETADIDLAAHGTCAIADGLGIQMALGHPAVTRERAAAITRGWLAAVLQSPAIAAD
jgi:AcrR family transcriptional regulator